MVVEDVAVDFAERSRPAAEAVDLDRRLALHGPEGAVHVVDQRLRHVVAREPGEVILIAELILDFVQFWIAVEQTIGAAEQVSWMATISPMAPS